MDNDQMYQVVGGGGVRDDSPGGAAARTGCVFPHVTPVWNPAVGYVPPDRVARLEI